MTVFSKDVHVTSGEYPIIHVIIGEGNILIRQETDEGTGPLGFFTLPDDERPIEFLITKMRNDLRLSEEDIKKVTKTIRSNI